MAGNRPPGFRRSALIVHSDDFGETVEITKGISECIEAGVVTSTTILANMPGTGYALAEAARLGDRASFGVHLNLCEGEPLTAARSLTDGRGRFLPKRIIAARALLGRLDLGEAEAELRAQIERIRQAGVRISHLDSHKHLHQLPGLAGVVAGLAAESGIERVRCTLERGLWIRGFPPTGLLSRAVRVRLARLAARAFASRGLRFPGRTFDVRQLMATKAESRRVALLRGDGGVSEMICHPGTALADREKPGSCARHAELEFLRSPAFAGLLAAADGRLVTYWEC